MGATLGELRAAMNRLKGTLRSQMKMMEADLRKDPFPKLSLLRELGNAETEWNKVEDCYVHILTLTEDEQVEDDRLAYEELRTLYTDLNDRVEDALDDHRLEEEAELLGVKSAQLDEIKGQINSSASLVDSMFAADPDQSVITLEVQGMRRTAAEVKVHACEELMAKMRAAINTRKAATAEAATAAATAAEVAKVPAASMKITPRFK